MKIEKAKSGMTPLEIRNALHNANLNQAAIARELGLTPVHISYVIDGKRMSRRVHEAISEAIGVDIRRIWPDLYLIPGREPKIGRPRKNWHRKAA
jgi:lambda repressor-like predicted transcriptional regulator